MTASTLLSNGCFQCFMLSVSHVSSRHTEASTFSVEEERTNAKTQKASGQNCAPDDDAVVNCCGEGSLCLPAPVFSVSRKLDTVIETWITSSADQADTQSSFSTCSRIPDRVGSGCSLAGLQSPDLTSLLGLASRASHSQDRLKRTSGPQGMLWGFREDQPVE